MLSEEDMRCEFTAGLKPRVLGQIVDEVFEKMKLAGEVGSLLKIEEEIKHAVAAAKKQCEHMPPAEQLLLFPGTAPQRDRARYDFSDLKKPQPTAHRPPTTDSLPTAQRLLPTDFWDQAEDRILDALKDYAEQNELADCYRECAERLDATVSVLYQQDVQGEAVISTLDLSETALVEATDGYIARPRGHSLLAYCLGIAFGRWDVRIALPTANCLPPTTQPDPFDPLPVCPPGMLVGPDGLPAEPNRIVSEEWLRKRAEGGMQYADGKWTIREGDDSLPTARCILSTGAEYPLRISWDGVLVEDGMQYAEGSRQIHKDDIVLRVREVLDLLWKDKSHEIEQEACNIFGVSDLRDYFHRPAGFFSGSPEALFQEPSQGPDLLAAVHAIGVIYDLALLPPLERPDALHGRQQVRGTQDR